MTIIKRVEIIALLGLSALVYSLGISWGLPEEWHPDEQYLLNDSVVMARGRKFCPPTYFYGTLPKYALVLVLYPQLLAGKDLSEPSGSGATIFRPENLWLARFFSSLTLAASLILFFLILKEMVSKASAFLVSLLLLFSPAWVCIGHFLKPHIFLTFLTLLSLLWSIKFILGSRLKYLYWSSFVSGLTIGVISTGIFNFTLLIFPAVAYGMGRLGKSPEGAKFPATIRLIIFVAISFLIGAFLAYPCALIHPFAFFQRHYIASVQFSTGRGILAPLGLIQQPEWLFRASGGVGLLLSLAGMIYYFTKARAKTSEPVRKVVNWLILPAILVYYFTLARSRILELRYFVSSLPFYYIFIALSLDQLLQTKPKKWVLAGAVLPIAGLIGLALMIDYYFLNDTRAQARNWITINLPAGSKIETTSHLPELKGDYQIIPIRWTYERPPVPCWAQELEKKIKKALVDSGSSASCNHTAYQKFWRKELEVYLHNYSEPGLKERDPDYIVASSIFYDRYLKYPNQYPSVKIYWEELLAGKYGYQVIQKFSPPRIVRLTTEFVSPEILILKKIDQGEKNK